MSWLWLLANEFSGHSRSRAFEMLGGTLVALSLLAVNVGLQQFEIETAQAVHYGLERDRDRGAHQSLAGRQPGAAFRVVRPPVPGTAVVRGLGRTMPAYWEPTPAGLVDGPVSASVDRRSELGALFDFEGVARVVLGLLAIFVGIRSVSSHRTDHTLQTLLDLPISRWSLALVKLAAGVMTVGSLVAGVGAGILALVWMRAPTLLSGELPSIVIAASIVALLYAVILVAAGMVVGSLSKAPTTAGTLGIGLWGILTLAYPQVVQLGTHAVAPLPLRALIEDEQGAVYAARLESTVALMGDAAGRLQPLGASGGALADTPEVREALDRLWQADAAETRLMVGTIRQRAELAAVRHERLAHLLGTPNPAMIFNRILAALAATGAADLAAWERALTEYQHRVAREYYDDPARLILPVPSGIVFERVLLTRKRLPTFDELPRFEAPMRDLKGRLYDARLDLAILAAFMLLTSTLAIACFPSSGS